MSTELLAAKITVASPVLSFKVIPALVEVTALLNVIDESSLE